MTDTTIRVRTKTRQRLKIWASLHDISQDEAIWALLEKQDAPMPEVDL